MYDLYLAEYTTEYYILTQPAEQRNQFQYTLKRAQNSDSAR